MLYSELQCSEAIHKAVERMGFTEMTEVQEKTIPVMMAGRDVIAKAPTGTGKTCAFGIPLAEHVDPAKKYPQAVVMAPTRELAQQIAADLEDLTYFMPEVQVACVYGGANMDKQAKRLAQGCQIVVATPGRLMDHYKRRSIDVSHVTQIVLDEADEMLNMGFREDMETILSQIPNEHQTVLFSATMPKSILDITGQFQNNPILIKTVKKELTVPLIKQYYYEVRRENKKEVVARLLDYYNPKLTLIFCNTKRMVEELSEDLKGRGYSADGIHGDLSQSQRDRVMESFRNGSTDILIATDVAARGIDVDDVEAVINFDVPQDNEYYVHRIGRTGRAGRKGRAFTLVVGREIYKVREIEATCKTTMKAKTIPSVADITEAKAQKILNEVLETLRNQDLTSATAIIAAKMEEEDCTALELAAAFLRTQLGEEKEEIPAVSYERKKRDRYSVDRERGGRHGFGRSERGGEKGRFAERDGKKDGKRNEKSRYFKENGDKKDKKRDKQPEKKKEKKIKLRMDGSVMGEKKKK